MKKILFALSLIAFMFLIGCSAGMEYTTTINNNFNYVIQYNMDNLRFSYINESDLLTYVADEGKDFKIMLNRAYENEVIESLLDSNNGVIDTLILISEESGVSISSMLHYSATELNELASANSITLTVDDIVGFIDLLAIKEQFSDSLFLRKTEYLELRLGRELTLIEESGLTDFQDGYNQLYYNFNNNYNIENKTFLQIVDDLDGLGYGYTQQNYDSMEIGYDLIIGLTDWKSISSNKFKYKGEL